MHLWLLLLAAPLAQCQCQCRSKVQCIGQFGTIRQAAATVCKLQGGGEGFCCKDILSEPIPIATRMAPMRKRKLKPLDVSSSNILNSFDKVRSQEDRKTVVDADTKGHNLFNKPRIEDKDLEDTSRKLFYLIEDIGISLRTTDRETGLDSDNSVEVDAQCPWTNSRRPKCERNSKYRSIDGSCNNQDNPLFGLSGTPFQRILDATYNLFGNTPRQATDGSPLPSARFVSQTVFSAGDIRDNDISVLFMQAGQFLDHDIAHTPNAGIGPINTPQCCLEDSRGRDWIYPQDPSNGQLDVCFPIEVLSSDSFWGRRGRRCMHFSRSSTSPTIFPNVCEAGRWEQRNGASHWIDATQVYGHTEHEREDVRDPRDRAFLAVSAGGSRRRALLPTCAVAEINAREPDSCDIANCGDGCAFVGGDLRVNEMPALTVQHTAWVREHNRVAKELKEINPRWNDEQVFEEARRIVIATWQNVIFSEWLPILLGPAFMRAFGLQPLTTGYAEDYDPEFDPSITNEFATAAFRFAHTLIAPNVPGMDKDGNNVTFVDLKDAFNNGAFVNQRGFIEDTVRGQSREPVPAFDSNFVEDVLDHLFESEEGDNGGLDLMALNIQRSREHGIPGYNQYREQCQSAQSNFGKARNFDDLTRGGWVSSENAQNLRRAYRDVDDIDLFPGGILEKPHKDALVGPTFKCIIGDQMARLKRGDRFYYERGDDPNTRFTLEQLDELRKSSMARVMCDNTDIERAQPLMFRIPGPGNELVSCTDGSIPKLNLDVFRDP